MKLLDDALVNFRALFERSLKDSVRAIGDDGTFTPPRLVDAMEHALLAPGKRLRPMIVLAAAQACERARGRGTDDDALFALCEPAALAVEHVHAYSLVHDDLPGMDDDDVRRGRPTVHIAFDEATAILAGDGLLTNAFAILARAEHHAARQVKELALAAGSAGMVGGQHDDTREGARTVEELEKIHARKTGALFRAAAVMGALSVDDEPHVPKLAAWARHLGLAFQIGDDVLDVTANPERAGKRLGRDEDKITFVTLLGVDEAKKRARAAADAASEAVAEMNAPLLVELARFAAERDH
jgi:geranylgeranyl pyrophosphate synthase